VRVLIWHVHGAWTEAFTRGRHDYLLPVTPERDADGAGRLGRDWPTATEVPVDALARAEPDVVVLQRPRDLVLAERWLGRKPGVDVPAVYLEHNTPRGDVPDTRHPVADRADIPLVHVTHFNDLLWDAGRAPTTVIEHGLPDPGPRYTGEIAAAAVVLNDPVRRWRVTGTDLIGRFAAAGVPVHHFGMRAEALPARLGRPAGLRTYGDLSTVDLHAALARRRCYLHLSRWTSLGLALIEAMLLGQPVAAIGSTEAYEAVPPGAGLVSTRVEDLIGATRDYLAEPDLAATVGARARQAALDRYGLERFLADWDRLLQEVTR
jgi:Glycosyl transferases group 1